MVAKPAGYRVLYALRTNPFVKTLCDAAVLLSTEIYHEAVGIKVMFFFPFLKQNTFCDQNEKKTRHAFQPWESNRRRLDDLYGVKSIRRLTADQ